MSAADPSLHPIRRSIGPGEIHFKLRAAARKGELFAVEAEYRPRRGWDVKKTRHLGLFGGWIGGASGDFLRTQREEFHHFRQHLTATDADMSFVVPLRDPADGYHAYQLAGVKVVGARTQTLEFERWFEDAPALDAGFGLRCETAELRGFVRPSGLGPHPLRGSLPLWPTLTNVDLEFTPVNVPELRLFDASQKHHWDGWRQTRPQAWPGGQTVVLQHTNSPVVWREHGYHPFPAGAEPPLARPLPPQGVLPGVQLEVYWPKGDSLDFPETRFDGDVDLVSVPLGKLPPRAAELLVQSVCLRPGQEPGSWSAKEWKEFEDILPEIERPLTVEMVPSEGNPSALRVRRQAGFTEPWICLFLTSYDQERRYAVTSLLVRPEPWMGPLPE